MILFCWAEAQGGERQRTIKEGSSALLLAKKALDFFEVLIFTGQTDMRRKRDSSRSINDKRRGKRFHTTIKLADGIVTQQNAIVHLVRGHVGLNGIPTVLIHRDTHDGESLRLVLLLKFDEPGDFERAGPAPSGPEVEQDHFATVVGQFDSRTIGVAESEVCRGLPVLHRLRLGGERLLPGARPEQGRDRCRHE